MVFRTLASVKSKVLMTSLDCYYDIFTGVKYTSIGHIKLVIFHRTILNNPNLARYIFSGLLRNV